MRTIAIVLLAALIGCSASTKPRPTTRSSDARSANTDPCATRLHDLCGPLLLYYATHRKLPNDPAELLAVPGFKISKELICPASRKPYTYNRAGIPTPGSGGRVILFDPTPAHANHRWAIAIQETTGDQPLIAKVIALPESFFHK